MEQAGDNYTNRCHPKFSERPSAKNDVKNSQGVNNNNSPQKRYGQHCRRKNDNN